MSSSMIETKQDSFQITLPSNASMDTFKENSANYFRTQLKKEIHLAGGTAAWEVALTAIQYPISWPNIIKPGQIGVLIKPEEKSHNEDSIPPQNPTSNHSPSDFHIFLTAAANKDKFLGDGFWNYLDVLTIPVGIYNSVEDIGKLLVEDINTILQTVNNALENYDNDENPPGIDLGSPQPTPLRERFSLDFKYDPVTYKAGFTMKGKGTIQLLSMDNFLDRIFGLRPINVSIIEPERVKIVNTYAIPCQGSCPCSLDKLDSLYVYSNVGQYQLVGDTEAQLLSVIPVLDQPTGNQKNVQLAYFACNPVYYIPVKMDVFQVIEIQLDTDKNLAFPFINNENEKVVARLDFRRKTGGGGSPFYLV